MLLLNLQMLMTRETRAKLAAGGATAKKATHAVIRVRLPDGLVLQGEFNGGEPVSLLVHFYVTLLSRCYCMLSCGMRLLHGRAWTTTALAGIAGV
jgi:hypothetical protein